VLRGVIDQARRQKQRSGLYLLLGSASLDLLKQSGESLAGRIAYLELGPLLLSETGTEQQDKLWLRGGFPESMLAPSDARSLRWRQNFIRAYLERDIPLFAPASLPTRCAASGPCWRTPKAACSMWRNWRATSA
jgi:predicted AAA+ superfamily ATPase